MSLLDPGQIIKKAFDESTDSLRVHISTSDVSTSSLVSIVDGAKQAGITAAGALKTDGSAVVQPVKETGFSAVHAPIRINYASQNVTSSYFVLITSLAFDVQELQIFDSSGETLTLAIGAAGSEVPQINIFPGGNGTVRLAIPAGSRISIKTLSNSATGGELNINFLG